jgi:hypothetical protein
MDKHNSVDDTTQWSAAQKLDLHQSDSSVDLFEYHDQYEAKSIQNHVASYGKTFQAIETGVENEYENMDVLVECNQQSGN